MAHKMTMHEPPVGVEVAAHRFAAACQHDGFDGFVDLICNDGKVEYIHFGGQFYAFIEGKWYIREEVD